MSKHRTIFGLIKHTQICLNRMIGVTHIIMDNRNSRTGRESVGIQKESRKLTVGQGTSHQELKTKIIGNKPFQVYITNTRDRTGATVSTSNDISFSILQAKDIVFQRRAYVNSTL